MHETDQRRVTSLLHDLEQGKPGAAEELLPMVYDELHQMASGVFRGQTPGHTLQPTALVHEVYVRLVRHDREWSGRGHFLAVAAKAMRQILANHAEKRRAIKRGGNRGRVSMALAESDAASPADEIDLVALHEALERLQALDERQFRVVELRFFGGLSVSDVSRLLDVSQRTVERDWRMARAWLRAELRAVAPEEEGAQDAQDP